MADVQHGDAGRIVGRVVALWRYPVKSMRGHALDAADVSWHGMSGDRRWAFIRDGMERSNFPWLTIREKPELWQYGPVFTEPNDPERSPTIVRTPSGREYDVADPELAAELGDGVRVIKQNRGVFDTAPLSLITVQGLATLGARVGTTLEATRFRANIVVDAPDAGEFPEETWVGRTLRIGGMRMRVDQRDQRCVMINVDPATTSKNPAVLRTVAREREACFGVYGSTVHPGRIVVGDVVTLLDD